MEGPGRAIYVLLIYLCLPLVVLDSEQERERGA